MKFGLAICFGFLLIGCEATFFFNLDKICNANPSFPPTDATIVTGPKDKGKAIQYGPTVPLPTAGGDEVSYLINTLRISDDITYFTYFRMTKSLERGERWVFFSLQDDNSTKTYTSIGLKAKFSGGQGNEGSDQNNGKLVQVLFFSQYTEHDKSSKDNELIITDEFKPDTWYSLSIRYKVTSGGPSRKRRNADNEKTTANVFVNCKEIGVIDFQEGRFDESYVPRGIAVLAGTKSKGSNDRFPGALAQSQVINGPDAFSFYSPCDADFSLQNIPSEPLEKEYTDKKLKLYEKLLNSIKPVALTCPETKPLRYLGENWNEGCTEYTCVNGKVVSKYTCRYCTDEKTGKKHERDTKWIDSDDKCTENTCKGSFAFIVPKKIKCISNLQCPSGYAPLKPTPTECCAKCGGETCKGNRQYYRGCKIPCGSGLDYVCETKELDCWCPLGYAENEDTGVCTKIEACPCKSGNIKYEPGQTAIRSSCSTCVCVNGLMRCFERC